jgi:hypothetical protein
MTEEYYELLYIIYRKNKKPGVKVKGKKRTGQPGRPARDVFQYAPQIPPGLHPLKRTKQLVK